MAVPMQGAAGLLSKVPSGTLESPPLLFLTGSRRLYLSSLSFPTGKHLRYPVNVSGALGPEQPFLMCVPHDTCPARCSSCKGQAGLQKVHEYAR